MSTPAHPRGRSCSPRPGIRRSSFAGTWISRRRRCDRRTTPLPPLPWHRQPPRDRDLLAPTASTTFPLNFLSLAIDSPALGPASRGFHLTQPADPHRQRRRPLSFSCSACRSRAAIADGREPPLGAAPGPGRVGCVDQRAQESVLSRRSVLPARVPSYTCATRTRPGATTLPADADVCSTSRALRVEGGTPSCCRRSSSVHGIVGCAAVSAHATWSRRCRCFACGLRRGVERTSHGNHSHGAAYHGGSPRRDAADQRATTIPRYLVERLRTVRPLALLPGAAPRLVVRSCRSRRSAVLIVALVVLTCRARGGAIGQRRSGSRGSASRSRRC